MLTQAASWRSTSAWAMVRASSSEPQVVRTSLLSVIRNRSYRIEGSSIEFELHWKDTSRTMARQIKFGTSGWRAVMAEEFTFANVHRAVHGIARYVSSQKSNGAKVIVGRDPRFLGETFCSMAADLLSGYGITPLVIAEPAPTPAISYAV